MLEIRGRPRRGRYTGAVPCRLSVSCGRRTRESAPRSRERGLVPRAGPTGSCRACLHSLRHPSRSRRPSRLRGGPHLGRSARFHRRRASRRRRSRISRPGPSRLLFERSAVAEAPHNHQPGPFGTPRKGGSGLDLPVAVGVLVADETVSAAPGRGHRRSSESWGSTARCARSRYRAHGGRSQVPAGGGACQCAARGTLGRAVTRSGRRPAWASSSPR